MKYLFDCWDKLKEKLAEKYIMLFLDYDGTLTPIVETPKQAVIPKGTKGLLGKLSKNTRCKIAIISGRILKDIKNKMGLKNIIYVGNHGLEIEGPEIKYESPLSPGCRAILEDIKNDLTQKLSTIKGVILEDKVFSLAIHYRLVDKKYIPRVKAIVHEAVMLYLVRDKVEIKSGKMVLEVRIPLEWDKGKVVLWLLARQKFALNNRDLIPIYIGDDKTDEDAFKALKDRGMTIFVGEPKTSYAQYYLRDTDAVAEFLKRILEIQRG